MSRDVEVSMGVPMIETSGHDPMCPNPLAAKTSCHCALIAKVREDERGKALADGDLAGYLLGQRDERERWEAEGPWFKSVVHQCCEDKETARAEGQRDERERIRTGVTNVLMLEECDDYLAACLAVIDGGDD